MSKKNSSSVDIFDLLSDSADKAEKAEKADRKKQREELLASTKTKDLFQEGNISINKHTCIGGQCKLCIKACPTNALYWKTGEGEVGITENLCVYCGACVLSCMVDDCIKVKRKREEGATEKFSKTRDVMVLENCINATKRFQRVRDVFPDWIYYCENYPLKK
jgi:NAD-dependent dihydropyrimidine dehydrogenase PreA subunit